MNQHEPHMIQTPTTNLCVVARGADMCSGVGRPGQSVDGPAVAAQLRDGQGGVPEGRGRGFKA